MNLHVSVFLKNLILSLCLFLTAGIISGQKTVLDSLQQQLNYAKADTNTLKILNEISIQWQGRNRLDSSLKYAVEAKALAERLLGNKPIDITTEGVASELGRSLVNIAVISTYSGNYAEAL